MISKKLSFDDILLRLDNADGVVEPLLRKFKFENISRMGMTEESLFEGLLLYFSKPSLLFGEGDLIEAMQSLENTMLPIEKAMVDLSHMHRFSHRYYKFDKKMEAENIAHYLRNEVEFVPLPKHIAAIVIPMRDFVGYFIRKSDSIEVGINPNNIKIMSSIDSEELT